MPPNTKSIDLLLVEDSPDDAALMIAALKEGSLDLRITLVEDGEAALALLHKAGPHANATRPELILLDLHLPLKNGFEVLAELKEHPELRRIPVVIITSSDRESVFVEAYNLHANCCVSKPVDQDQYALTVKKIENFWLHVAQRVRWT